MNPFEMFKGMGQVATLMRNASRIQAEMEQLQQRLGQINAEGDAGAGMVKVKVNGRLEVLSCTLSDEALKLNDREMLEDLIRAATNQALTRARQVVADETGKMAASLGLPAGINLPGMS
jgi:DNA-binding YbaB/EbfC family protein